MLKLYFWALLCAFALIKSVQSHKVLVLVPLNGKSHWFYMQAFVKELIERGHEVTCVTSIAMESKPKNYTEILIDPPFDMQNIGTYKPKSEVFKISGK